MSEATVRARSYLDRGDGQLTFTNRVISSGLRSNFAGQHLGTVALGIRHVLCTPLRVVRYLEQSSSDIEQRPIGVL